MTDKPIKTSVSALENQQPQDDHEYKQVIEWGPDDKIITRFFIDGQEVTAGQYRRQHKHKPGDPIKVNIDWSEADNGQEN